MEAVVVQRDLRSRRIATLFASAGFLVMVVGVTYFAILVLTAHYGSEERRYTAFRELGMFLSGEGNLAWYQDARLAAVRRASPGAHHVAGRLPDLRRRPSLWRGDAGDASPVGDQPTLTGPSAGRLTLAPITAETRKTRNHAELG